MRIGTNSRNTYLDSLSPCDSPFALKAKLEAQKLNKDGISIGLYEAHMLQFFIRLFGCVNFVEIGTLTGYSGLKILEALPPHGHLWTLELNEEQAQIAGRLFDEAGYEGRYSQLIGRAEDLLATISDRGPFDGVFIDANKAAYPKYLEWAMEAVKGGGLILADNTLLRGVVPEDDEPSPSKMIQQLRHFNKTLSDTNLFDSILIPTDEGLSVAIKKIKAP